ncbi:stage III sporulation protein AF [Clostridium ihumii]|uniref:stage III sporulation protein AF n=1 Tax=Clostridium ihumii TaxID=1470356 RepID=UPI00058BF565|nr:stage III sporulation protein AF [Clostridium ihumii]
MIEGLRNFIIILSSAVFFITAVQMILPDNSMKKYCKFVLGLVLVVIMLNPIVKLFNSEINIYDEIEKSTGYIFDKEYEVDYEKYKDINIKNTIQNFEKNMEKQCIEDLQTKYSDKKFTASVKASFDEEKKIFNIESIEVALCDSIVPKIKKIEIGNDKAMTVDNTNDETSNEIKKYISNKYNVSEESVLVCRK